MSSTRPEQNILLAALREPVRARLFPQLETVEMPLGEVLYESGSQLHHVYFPTTLNVFSSLCHGERCVGGERGGGERRHSRHFVVHGRRDDSESGGGTERGSGFSVGAIAHGGIPSPRSGDAFVA